jgi:hypothetical protein
MTTDSASLPAVHVATGLRLRRTKIVLVARTGGAISDEGGALSLARRYVR